MTGWLRSTTEAGEALIRRSVAIRKDGVAGPQYLFEIAEFLLKEGQRQQAPALLNLGAELHPESEELLTLRAQALEKHGRQR